MTSPLRATPAGRGQRPTSSVITKGWKRPAPQNCWKQPGTTTRPTTGSPGTGRDITGAPTRCVVRESVVGRCHDAQVETGQSQRYRIVGLFAGIGGLEAGLHAAGHEARLLCEVWEPARAVLRARFPGLEIAPDVQELRSLPDDADVITAGFPCTDLSQAGRTAGINGSQSGLVAHVFRLADRHDHRWLVLENVRNMLALDGGRAMHYLVSELEDRGYDWAYRLVDSRFTGVPQRRQRVLLVASRSEDPRDVLLSDDAGHPDLERYASDAFGFYWTGLAGRGTPSQRSRAARRSASRRRLLSGSRMRPRGGSSSLLQLKMPRRSRVSRGTGRPRRGRNGRRARAGSWSATR
jgi:site-specific DNA-cytosine methylase